jgi:hypothetical protein
VRGAVLLPPLTLVVKPTKVKNFFFEKKQKILYYFSYLRVFSKHIFFFIISTFPESRTMPQVKHRVANVTSYGLQGAPITLQTDLSVLGERCTQPGAKPTTESKDRKIRPLGYFYGRWHTPPDELPAFFPPFSEASAVARGSLEKTDQIQKNEKSSSHQQDEC